MSVPVLKKQGLVAWAHRGCYWPALLLILALYQFGSGVAIYTKAILAQYLIAAAWQESIQIDNPVKPWSWADTWPVARLKIGTKDLYVLEGASGRVLAFGPGHMSQTAMPGMAGNSVIAGHRDTHFELLQDLAVGEFIEMETFSGTMRYKVIGLHIVEQSQTDILNDSAQPMLTLITCYPFNSLQTHPTSRYVVRAIQI